MIPIPPGKAKVIVLEQTSHMDWDWLNTFETNITGDNAIDDGYFHNEEHPARQPAMKIYTQATALLTARTEYPKYWYSTCEVGFLKAFAERASGLFRDMLASGGLSIVGGGITSPDNLLSNGECFLRNYVVGLKWMESVGLLPWNRCVWLPDDFGHDSQLPATLAAMDAVAVGFARCPLASGYQGCMTYDQPAPQAGKILNLAPAAGGGCDFYWQASDGSKVFAHWMPAKYSQGSTLYGKVPARIDDLLNPNETCSPTPYVHVPVADDFYVPLTTLQKMIKDWNDTHADKVAVLSTFDQYVKSVLDYLAKHPEIALRTRSFRGTTEATSFRSNPYWMGFYASRMNLKSGHQQATRMLLAAETLDAILAWQRVPLPDAPQKLHDAWAELVPSTHHDYITGTATDRVVSEEQMIRLQSAKDLAADLMQSQLDRLAAALNPASPALVVYNPLGFNVFGALVEVDKDRAASLRIPPDRSQVAANGNVLLYVDAPSAGYRMFVTDYPVPPAAPTVTSTDGGASYTLANGLISATIAAAANWGLTDVRDKYGRPVARGNTLSFYRDGGNIYEFGYECRDTDRDCYRPNTFQLLAPQVIAKSATVTEGGTNQRLRVTVIAKLTLSINGTTFPYTLQYSLAAGKPYVEMTLIGKAPYGTSVFTNFTFEKPIDAINHGTPMHSDFKTPAKFGKQPFNTVIEATHDYVVPVAVPSPLAAIYHQAVPGWGFSGNTLYGAVMRNTPGDGCDGRGAEGSDGEEHTITYALRAGSELSDLGQALREARAYNTPLWTTVAKPGSGTAPPLLSLAAVSSDAGILTSVKRGTFDKTSLFLRIYKPRDGQAQLVVGTLFPTTGAVKASALEQPPVTDDGGTITIGNRQLTLTTERAITTIKIPSFGTHVSS